MLARDALDQLRAETRARLGKMLAAGSSVALLDFPNHSNAGDSFIWAGEAAHLVALNVRRSAVADQATFRSSGAQYIGSPETVLLHGGGNLGDRYPEYQAFREDVLDRFSKARVIQLPQSIEFADRANAERARAAFERHRDFTLMVRDKRSLEKATDLFPSTHVVLCPDMALGRRLAGGQVAAYDVALLRRRDGEAPDSRRFALPNGVTYWEGDWSLRRHERWWNRAVRVPITVPERMHLSQKVPMSARRWAYDQQANLLLQSAVHRLSRGRIVVTDRLHAALMAVTLGLPVVIVDNPNRKVSSFFDTWFVGASDVHICESSEEATTVVADLVTAA